MDKFRRNRKTSPPPPPPTTKSQPGYLSNETATAPSLSSSSTSAATKFTIQQKIPTGTAPKKGPYSVKRTVDPNEVFIKRRIGEGAKPLFSRDELRAKRSASPKHKRTSSSSSSSSSSSPEVRRRSTKETSSKSSQQIIKKKSPEKVPYFLDEKRENERIKRVYGSRRSSRSLSRDRRRSLAQPSRNRSRTKSPPAYIKRRYQSTSYRRTPSRERYRSRHHRTDYSRSRSRSRERRRKDSSYRHRNESIDERSLQQPATQFIPVPVPVEYPYMPPAWGPPMIPPPGRYPFMMRPPIPAQVPFMPRHFHPPRYYMPNGFQRGNFRPRY